MERDGLHESAVWPAQWPCALSTQVPRARRWRRDCARIHEQRMVSPMGCEGANNVLPARQDEVHSTGWVHRSSSRTRRRSDRHGRGSEQAWTVARCRHLTRLPAPLYEFAMYTFRLILVSYSPYISDCRSATSGGKSWQSQPRQIKACGENAIVSISGWVSSVGVSRRGDASLKRRIKSGLRSARSFVVDQFLTLTKQRARHGSCERNPRHDRCARSAG